MQKQRMLRGIREKHERLRAPHCKMLRTALIAAVCCILISTSAFAAVSFGLMDGLRTFLQPATPEQEELLAQGAYVVNKSDSNPNGTLEVKQVIGDSNLVYLLLEFIAPEGTVLDLDGYRFDGLLNVGQQTTGAGFVKIADGDETDNHITLIMCEPTREPIAENAPNLNYPIWKAQTWERNTTPYFPAAGQSASHWISKIVRSPIRWRRPLLRRNTT